MRVAITQPNYLPWSGYFELLDSVDMWVSLDNVQLSRRSFVVRNCVKGPDDQVKWLTASVRKHPRSAQINEVLLSDNSWWLGHSNRLRAYYRDARYSAEYIDYFCDLIRPRSDENMLAAYNQRVVKGLAEVLGIRYDILRSSDLRPRLVGSAQSKMLTLCRELGVTELRNFQMGIDRGLYDPAAFSAAGISLIRQQYSPQRYAQHGQTMIANLSVVDLLLHTGPEALSLIRKGSRWTPA
ncbi:MAG: WbqC family protein [Nannocystaceae bacterium]